MKKDSVIKGTVILIAANTISKILGAVLKIPLTYILGEEGMAIYNTAFSVYIMLLSFVLSSIPFVLSAYISEQLACKNRGNVRYAVRFSMFIMLALGLVLSAVMYFGADFFALAMKDPKAGLSIRAISPAIFFVAVGAVYKSCYQGFSRMLPTAVSQVAESFFKLIVGYSLASWFISFSVRTSAAAAIFGVTAGEVFATALLFLMYIPYRRETSVIETEHSRHAVISAILATAVPLTLTSVISGSLSLLETSVIRAGLTAVRFSPSDAVQFLHTYSRYTHLFDGLESTGKLSYDGARWLYGAYTGYAGTVFNLPLGILASFSTAVLPAVTHKLASGNMDSTQKCANSALKIILVLSVPCALLMYVFSEQLLYLLFKNTASAHMLHMLSPCIILAAYTQLAVSLQYSAGRVVTPFIFDLICLGVKTALSYILIRVPLLNIYGVIYAVWCAELLRLLLNSVSMRRSLRFGFIPCSAAAKILFSAVCTYLTARRVYILACAVLNNSVYGLFFSVFVSAAVYCLCILLTGAVKKEDIVHLSH